MRQITFGQVELLLWRILKLKQRSLNWTVVEILLPVILVFVGVTCLTTFHFSPKTEPHPGNMSAPQHLIIGYAPLCPATDKLMSKVEKLLIQRKWKESSPDLQVVGFNSEYSMVEFCEQHPEVVQYAYSFGNVTSDTKDFPRDVHLILRPQVDKDWNDMLYGEDFPASEGYLMQTMMEAFISLATGRDQNISVKLEKLPDTGPRTKAGLYFLAWTVSQVEILITILIMSRNVYIVARERDSGLVDLMVQMGVSPILYWLSWYMVFSATALLVAMSFVSALFFSVYTEPVFKTAASSLFGVYMAMFAVSTTSLSILASALWWPAKHNTIAAFVMYKIIPGILESFSGTFPQIKYVLALCPATNLKDWFRLCASFEDEARHFDWESVGQTLPDKRTTALLLLLGQLISTPVYLTLAWLSLRIQALEWSLWSLFKLKKRHQTQRTSVTSTEDTESNGAFNGIRVHQLSRYKHRKLNNMTLNMKENSITAFTGSEHAGKLGLLLILKGARRFNAGSVKVYGMDLIKDMSKIRKITGVCPQEPTALMNNLTVAENLRFFAKLKSNVQGKSVTDVSQLAAEFELRNALNQRVDHLKKARKRILQLAIAFTGQNKVVILEHPTKHMDPFSKGKVCGFIRSHAVDKTVVMCTNSVEDAEMTGDRIVVVTDGTIRCCGSVPFLQKLFGAGYLLSINLNRPWANKNVRKLVRSLVRKAIIVEERELRIVFLLQHDSTPFFYELFSSLEEHKESLGVAGYNIDTTSMEEAILNIFQEPEGDVKIEEVTTSVTTLSQTTGSRHEDSSVVPRKRVKFNDTLPNDQGDDVDGTTYNRILTGILNHSRQLWRRPVSMTSTSTGSGISIKVLEGSKYKGWWLLAIQAWALIKKRIVLSTCLLHLELIQIVVISVCSFMLFTSEAEQPLKLEAHEEDLSTPYTTNLPVVLVTQGKHRNKVTARLVKAYKAVFSDYMPIEEFDENEFTMIEEAYRIALRDGVPVRIAASFDVESPSTISATAWYIPSKHQCTVTTSMVAVMNAFLWHFTNNTDQKMRASGHRYIGNVFEYKYVMTDVERLTMSHERYLTAISIVTFMMVPYCMVLERATGSQSLQYLSKVSPWLYWLIAFLFDFGTYLFLCNFSLIMLVLFEELIEYGELIDVLIGVELANGVMMILFTYVIQHWFSQPFAAVVYIMLINFVLADKFNILRLMIGETMFQLKQFSPLDHFFELFPSFLRTTVHRKLLLNRRISDYCSQFEEYCSDPHSPRHHRYCCPQLCEGESKCLHYIKDIFSMDEAGIGIQLILIAAHSVFWFDMLVLIENNISIFTTNCRRPKMTMNKEYRLSVTRYFGRRARERVHSLTQSAGRIGTSLHRLYLTGDTTAFADPGVVQERQTLNDRQNDKDGIALLNVTKIVKGTTIVSNLSLRIEDGDIFCFVNSDFAPTSMIVQLLGGLEKPTSGQVRFGGKFFRKKANIKIGYCPPNDAHIYCMTGREVLTLYASLRGFHNVKTAVDTYLKIFQLTSVADKRTSHWGEDKRRLLSIAVALIGEPELVLLTDPLSSLDLVGKNLVLKALEKIAGKGRIIVLTTNNVEEITGIATCIAMMVAEKLLCLGSPKILRDTYCASYTLLAKVDALNTEVSTTMLVASLKERFPNCMLYYSRYDLVNLYLPYEDDSLADIFALMESAKKHLKILDYKLRHTNLNDVMQIFEQSHVDDSETPTTWDGASLASTGVKLSGMFDK